MRNEDIVAALMAAAALVSASDGTVSVEERHVVTQLIEATGLAGLTDLAFAQFNKYATALKADPAGGRAAAWQALDPVARHPQVARTIVRACVQLSKADRQAEFAERQIVRELLDRLHLDPKDLG